MRAYSSGCTSSSYAGPLPEGGSIRVRHGMFPFILRRATSVGVMARLPHLTRCCRVLRVLERSTWG